MTTAASGADAVEVARRDRPQLVLLDVRLGGTMSGHEVCRILKDELRPEPADEPGEQVADQKAAGHVDHREDDLSGRANLGVTYQASRDQLEQAAGEVTPSLPLDGPTSGRMASGISSCSRIHGSQAFRSSEYSIVRDAFVGSVAWTPPPVRLTTNGGTRRRALLG